VLADKVLNEVILAVADVRAIRHVALPPFELSMSLALVPHPVCFPLEGLGLIALRESTCERLQVLVDVLCPVRRLLELLHLKTEGTFKLRRQ
jgi:hypothetical protein